MGKIKIFVVLLVIIQLNCSKSVQKAGEIPEPVIEDVEETLEDEMEGEEDVDLPQPASPDTTETEMEENTDVVVEEKPKPVIVGAARFSAYLPKLKDKRIALLVNQTSMVGNTHLADTLLAQGVQITKIFAPEHGFRGEADAGAKIEDGKDPKTGISIISLYGSKRKPGTADLAGIDMVVFDIQDVGARFYTYISTMSYVMEACAENDLPFLVLDRPNPNGHYVDGPILETQYNSFVGLHSVPIVHGMTVAEYARMANEQGWLANGIQCDLQWVTCENYDHNTFYELPVRPSPNLPNMRSIYLYPSICFFEGTEVSVGRGTDKQFQVLGHPEFPEKDFQFTPQPMFGAQYPKHEGKVCYGYDLTKLDNTYLQQQKQLDLSYLLDFYTQLPNSERFFLKNLFFDKLAGTADLRKQIIAGLSESAIRDSWEPKLSDFKIMREKYLLYDDFGKTE